MENFEQAHVKLEFDRISTVGGGSEIRGGRKYESEVVEGLTCCQYLPTGSLSSHARC